MESASYTLTDHYSSNNHTDPVKPLPQWATSLSVVLVFFLIVLSFSVAKFVHKFKALHFIPESGIIMLFGLVLGLLNWISDFRLHTVLEFDTNVFDFLIIPAIIFESGYSLKKRGLFKNILTISLYAVIGTLISTIFVGLSLFIFARFLGVRSVGK
jgi:sodium/hydrogen exchanger 8